MRASALAQTRRHGAFPHADRVTLLELSLLGPLREASDVIFYLRQHPGTSQQANPDGPSLWRWFNTSARGSNRHPFFYLTYEKLRAVNRSHIRPWEKLRCYLRVAKFALGWMLPRAKQKLLRIAGRSVNQQSTVS